MPNWREVVTEIRTQMMDGDKNALDNVRRKYLTKVNEKTNRNVIAYYSGWLQKGNDINVAVNDKDKNAFMLNVHKLDRSLGLDLILHTPGGDLAATESIVDYLHSMFGNDIRAIIPQISMSAGTMIAFSCKEIMMGKQSNLGPIDPQLGGVPCQGVLSEFKNAIESVTSNPNTAAIWQVIIGRYHPTFLGSCQNAIDWSEKLVTDWLNRNMCSENPGIVDSIIKKFSDHDDNKTHSRHISINDCKSVGLTISDMEDDQELQDLILTVHHAFMHTFTTTNATKIVENHIGSTYVEMQNPSTNH